MVTVQMGVLLLDQLGRARTPSAPAPAAVLGAEGLALFDAAYRRSIDVLARVMGGPLGDIFLELFEDAAAACKGPLPSLDRLLSDATNVWPATASLESRLRLAQRMPAGDAEATQKAVLVFLVLRRHHYALRGEQDTLLPLRAMPLPQRLAHGSPLRLAPNSACARYHTPANAAQPGGRTLLKYFAVADGALLVLDVAPKEASEAARRHTLPSMAVVDVVVPLEHIGVEARRDHIQVTCHQQRWSTRMLFDTRTALLEAHHLLDAGRRRARQYKMAQIYEGLGIPDTTLLLPPRPCDFPDEPVSPQEKQQQQQQHGIFSLRRLSRESPRRKPQ